MKQRPNLARRVLPTAIALGLLAPAAYTPIALAQQSDELVEEIITIGSRRAERSATDSSVPVDVISGDDHDLRFTDPHGKIVGLEAKGKAKQDNSGFVVKVKNK